MKRNSTEARGKTLRRRATAAVVAVCMSAAIAIAGLFSTPEELIQPDAPAIVAQDAQVAEAGIVSPPSVPRRRGDRVRAWIARLPLVVRLVVLLPLYVVGRVLTLLLQPLISGLLPFIGPLLLQLILVLGVAMLAFRLLFPDTPIGKLFTVKNILWMLACALLLTLADRLLPLVWEDYAAYSAWGKALLTVAVPVLLFFVLRGRRRQPRVRPSAHA